MNTKDKMLTVDEAAKLWKVSIQTMYKWARLNRIPHVKLNSRTVRFYDLPRTNDLMIENTTIITRRKDGTTKRKVAKRI